MAKRQKKEPKPPSQSWLTTYGDMITLMLCFFVMLYNPTEIDIVEVNQMIATLSGDPTSGGQSLSSGRLADLGNTI
ncbi:MAG: flagellar motor protein MotB, partial [Spirochaetaceae bacterium]|nr:flagellar motor protein MotB [Spirochaetaceae bacterium]